jgi:hypothetical protein
MKLQDKRPKKLLVITKMLKTFVLHTFATFIESFTFHQRKSNGAKDKNKNNETLIQRKLQNFKILPSCHSLVSIFAMFPRKELIRPKKY